jgi:glycosyltransferase involved in cell wall biosynthesis
MIAFIGDFRYPNPIGGASLVDHYLSNNLKSAGYSVAECAAYSEKSNWNAFQSDVYNIHVISALTENSIKSILELNRSGRPYILIRHDVPTFVSNPDRVSVEWKRTLHSIFASAKCVIFISPLQKSIYLKAIPIINWAIVPPPINFDRFRASSGPRPTDSLYLGQIARIRGIEEAIRFHRLFSVGTKLTVCGTLEEPELFPLLQHDDLRVIASVSREQVPEILAQHRRLLYFPNLVDSFCLKVLEAEMCGLDVETHRDRIGRYSYSAQPEMIAEHMQLKSSQEILEIIDSAIRNAPTIGKYPAHLV